MWKLLKAEFGYNKINLLVMMILLLCINFSYGSVNFLMPMITFLMVNTIFTRMNTEKRVCRYIQLPLSVKQIAVIRLLLILIPFFIVIAIYITVYLLSEPIETEGHRWMILIFGLALFIFQFLLIPQDLFSHSSKRNQIITRTLILIMVVLTFLMALGALLLFMQTKQGTLLGFVKYIPIFFEFISSWKGIILCYLVILGMSCLTVFTFLRRKAYLH